jgi:hypothetical protein
MKHATAFILALATLTFTPPAFAGQPSKSQMSSAQMNHMMKSTKMPTCKGATVYAVASSRTYYMKGTTMYGHAKGGMYMCQAAANAKGYHAAKP